MAKKALVKKTKLLTNELVTTGRSQGEEIVIALLRLNFPGIKIERNDKSVLGRQELDIHLVDYKIAIEVQGPTHYSAIYGEKRFQESQERDRRKKATLDTLGFHLIEVDIHNFTKENMFKSLKELMVNQIIPELKQIMLSRYKAHQLL